MVFEYAEFSNPLAVPHIFCDSKFGLGPIPDAGINQRLSLIWTRMPDNILESGVTPDPSLDQFSDGANLSY